MTGANIDGSLFDGAVWWTYIDIIAANYEPWLIFMLIGTFVALKYLIKNNRFFLDSFEKFVIVWVGLPLILFHFMKRYQSHSHFIVFIYVPFSIISAWGLLYVLKDRKDAVVSYLLLISIIFSFLCFSIKLLPKALDNQHYVNTVGLMPKMMEIKDQI